MQKYSFIVGQPLPSPGIPDLYRLAHIEPPLFSCFMCLPQVVPDVLKKIPKVLALGADDMRHLDGWVFFNFKMHGASSEPALLEPGLIGLLSRASIQFDMHLGHDPLESPRIELNYTEEDELNPSYDVHMGVFEDSETMLEQSMLRAYPDGWRKGWIFSGKYDNGLVSLCLHMDTGLALRTSAKRQLFFDETNMRIALTDEQRSRLQAQGKMFYSMYLGEMRLVAQGGEQRVVPPYFVPPPALDEKQFPNLLKKKS